MAQFLNGLKGEKQQRSSDDPPSRQPSPPPIEPNLNLAVNHVAHDANSQQANNSFLHNLRKESLKSYGDQETNRSSDNPKPMSNSGRLADRKAIFEASSSSSSSSSISSSCSNSSSPDTGKRTFSLPSPPRPSPTGPSSTQEQKTFAPPRATEPAQYGAQSLVEETGGLGRLADRKAKFETKHNSSSVVGGLTTSSLRDLRHQQTFQLQRFSRGRLQRQARSRCRGHRARLKTTKARSHLCWTLGILRWLSSLRW